MTNYTLSHEDILKYAQRFSQKISVSFFEKKQSITGNEILSLCPIKQVNYFILQNIHQEWIHSTQQIQNENPYFDYTNPIVAEALENFMNILSQHICIKQSTFEPLLLKATEQTLFYITNPEFFIEQAFFAHTSIITDEKLSFLQKYIKIYPDFFSEIQLQMHNIPSPEREKGIFKKIILHVKKHIPPLAAGKHIEEFHTIMPIKKIHTPNIPFSYSEEQPEKENNQPKWTNKESFLSEKDMEETSINQKFAENTHTPLYQSISKPIETLSDTLQKTQNQNVFQSLPFYQRYRFIYTLFQNNEAAYKEATDSIENINIHSFEESANYILGYYGKKYNWDTKSEEVKEFLKILCKKFL
ncbi:MAG: hypothetical protein QM536_03225 [Chitinophagaceae bacterium]|nr:hypothetical protein [Chitinophagaceae bacterium]